MWKHEIKEQQPKAQQEIEKNTCIFGVQMFESRVKTRLFLKLNRILRSDLT